MKIRRKQRILAFATLVVVAAVGLFLFRLADIRGERVRNALLIEDISMGVFELHSLTADYLLRADERTVRLWRSRHQTLQELLFTLQVENLSDHALVETIAENSRDLDDLFGNLLENERKPGRARDPAYRELVAGQLLTRTRTMISAAYQLSRANRVRLTGVMRIGGIGILAFLLLLLLVAAGSSLAGRSLIHALEMLRKGTQRIAAGDLDHRIGMDRPDELGELSRDFDSMTRSLRESREALKESERRFHASVETLIDGFAILSAVRDGAGRIADFRYEYINEAGCRLNGRSREETVGRSYLELFPAAAGSRWLEGYMRTVETGEPLIRDALAYEGAFAGGAPSGRIFDVKAVRMGDGVAVSWMEVTERKRAEEALTASLAEKDILLRELSHRTKNNMQVIVSLLALQAAASKDAALAGVLAEAQNRIRTMSLIHEKLYRSGDFSSLSMKEYVKDLMPSLLTANRGVYGKVKPVLELEEVVLSLDTAIPCGLIINELVSNSLKHAFAGRETGTIFLSLRNLGDEVELRYKDDGPGLPRELELFRIETLGLKLVYNLAVRQLRGTMEVEKDSKAEFVFRFRDLEVGKWHKLQ